MPYVSKKYSDDVKEDLKLLLGCYLKHHREDDGISLNYVSDSTGINKGLLSQVENGKAKLSNETMANLCAFYDIQFKDNPALLYELRERLEDIYYAYVILDDKQESELLQKIMADKEQYIHSYSFFTYQLITLIYSIKFKQGEDEIGNIINMIKDYFAIMSTDEKCIYLNVISMYYLQTNHNDEAYLSINKALRYAHLSKMVTLPLITLYHAVIIALCCNKVAKAFAYCIDGMNECRQQNNYQRMFYLQIYQGNCYSKLGLCKNAEEQYINFLNNTKFLNNSEIEITVYENLCWNSIKAMRFEDAIKYTQLTIEKGSRYQNLYIYVPYSLFMLGRKDECLKSIEENVVSLEYDKHLSLFLYALKDHIHNNMDGYLNNLIAFYHHNVANHDYETQSLTLSMLLEYYEEQSDYEQMSIVLKSLLKLYQQNHDGE